MLERPPVGPRFPGGGGVLLAGTGWLPGAARKAHFPAFAVTGNEASGSNLGSWLALRRPLSGASGHRRHSGLEPESIFIRRWNRPRAVIPSAHLPASAVAGFRVDGVCWKGRPPALVFSGGGRGAARGNRTADRARRARRKMQIIISEKFDKIRQIHGVIR